VLTAIETPAKAVAQATLPIRNPKNSSFLKNQIKK
jgi:hypothetical protein